MVYLFLYIYQTRVLRQLILDLGVECKRGVSGTSRRSFTPSPCLLLGPPNQSKHKYHHNPNYPEEFESNVDKYFGGSAGTLEGLTGRLHRPRCGSNK